MIQFTLKKGAQPSPETLERLAALRDEDIVFDEDCPELLLSTDVDGVHLASTTVRERVEKDNYNRCLREK